MVKVKCIRCGTIGFTAAPNYVRCAECGGKHRIIPFRKSDLTTKTKIGYYPFTRQAGIIF